jgi:pyruvate kinase
VKHEETDGQFEARAQAALEALGRLEAALALAESDFAAPLRALPEATRAAGRNLVHYVALRQLDIRPLQRQLTQLGLSSLGRAEVAVEDAVTRTGNMLRRALGKEPVVRVAQCVDDARAELSARSRDLLGTLEPPTVMVTMPSEAAHDAGLIRELLAAGMNVMRIDCAHDTAEIWTAMVGHLRTAERELACGCKVLFGQSNSAATAK